MKVNYFKKNKKYTYGIELKSIIRRYEKGSYRLLDNIIVIKTYKRNKIISDLLRYEIENTSERKIIILVFYIYKDSDIGHWATVILDKNDRTLIYFDPLAISNFIYGYAIALSNEINKIIPYKLKYFEYTNIAVQRSKDTHNCGVFVVKFITDQMKSNISLQTWINDMQLSLNPLTDQQYFNQLKKMKSIFYT